MDQKVRKSDVLSASRRVGLSSLMRKFCLNASIRIMTLMSHPIAIYASGLESYDFVSIKFIKC
jgi:hypothetical protein